MKKVLFCLLCLSALLLSSCGSTPSSSPQESNTPATIIDLTQFSRISTSELFDLMGGEGEKDAYGISLTTNSGTNVQGDIYIFKDQQLEFVVAEDTVIRATYNAPSYYDLDGEPISYAKKADIPSIFGITLGTGAKVIADTPAAYRLSPVNDSVADFWVTLMDDSAKTFEQVKVTYNLNYFS